MVLLPASTGGCQHLCNWIRSSQLTISYDSYPRLNDIVDALWPLAQYHLATAACVFGIARADFNVTTNVPRQEHLVVCLDLLTYGAYSLHGRIPDIFCEAHGVARVLQSDVKQNLAMAFGKAVLDMLGEGSDIVFCRVGKKRL